MVPYCGKYFGYHSNSWKILNNLAHLGQWDPQYLESLCLLSKTLTSLGCHSSGDIGILSTVDPLALVSNYYLFISPPPHAYAQIFPTIMQNTCNVIFIKYQSFAHKSNDKPPESLSDVVCL